IVIALERFGDPPDGPMLVITFDDHRTDRGVDQAFPAGPSLDREFQFDLLEEALDLARWIVDVVPQPMVEAVGIEDDRALSELLFETVRIQLRLLLAGPRIAPRALGFDH